MLHDIIEHGRDGSTYNQQSVCLTHLSAISPIWRRTIKRCLTAQEIVKDFSTDSCCGDFLKYMTMSSVHITIKIKLQFKNENK